MKKSISSIVLLISVFLAACSSRAENEVQTEEVASKEDSKAEQIIQNSIPAHGGELYEKANYRFAFRGSSYRFNNDKAFFKYEYKGLDKQGDSIHTLLSQNNVQVWKNNELLELDEKEQLIYSDNLNSVIYFATLPHKLGDQSVNKFYEGTTTIKDKSYEVIKVTFDQEGGGTDFDDEYYYWVNAETMIMDYLAYNYHTNGGGVRFRVAYNPRKVGGIHFQDYINYKAEVGTPLAELPALLESGELEELSRIETENITLVKN
jgi:uncharacterized protein YcfL